MAPRLQTEIDREALRRRLTAMNAEAPSVSTPPAAPANETSFFERPRVQQVISSLPTLIASLAGLNTDRAVPIAGALSQYQQRQDRQQQAQWQREMQEAQFAAQNQPPQMLPVGPDIRAYYDLPEGFQTTAEGLGALTQGYSTTQLGTQRGVETEGLGIENQRKQWELDLDQAFAERERGAALRQSIAEAAREEIGVEMDQATLDRYTQLTGPTVQQAIIEAQREAVGLGQDRLGLQFDQETFESAVAKFEAGLQQQLLQNEISQEEYDRMVKLGPTLIQQAQADLTSTVLNNRSKELENQYAASTLDARIQNANLQQQQNEIALQQAQVELEDARRRLAMARRLGPVEEQQAELEVERLEQQIANMQLEQQRLQQQVNTVGIIDPTDPDLALKLWEADSQQFRDAGMWVPPVAEYMSNLMSSNPLPWPQYVQQYNEELSKVLGPAPQTEQGEAYAFEWLRPEWQNAYSKAYNSYYDQFPQYTTETAPEFPPIEAWYANQTAPQGGRMSQDQLVEAWNAGTLQIGPAGELTTSGANASQVAQDIVNRRPDLLPAQHISQLRGMTQDEKQQFQQNFRVSVADVIAALQNM